MDKRYLIRLDDACPTMSATRWLRMEALLDKYDIRPLVGVIPANRDPKQQIDPADTGFWNKVKNWENKGWAIALHGYDHCYISQSRGINPLWPRSEFAGVPLATQKEKITNGVRIMAEHDIFPKYFFAPSHTFDENTICALRECSDIRIISDTVANRPYRLDDFVFIPQVGGHCAQIPLPGLWTFCLHPSVMTEANFLDTERFLELHSKSFISFQDVDVDDLSGKNLFSRLLSWGYFTYRRILNR